MKKFLILILLPAFLIGCANFVNNAKQAEYSAAVLADGAMKSYAVYWKTATNNPTAYNTTLPDLLTQRSNVIVLAKKVGASIATLDGALTIYATNSAAGKPLVTAGILALTGDAANIASTVNLFLGKNTLPVPVENP